MDLVGRRLDSKLPACVETAHLSPLAPIDDIRASADYRNDAALTMVRRLLASMDGGRA